MDSTDRQTLTLPVVEGPLVPIREYVGDFGEDELDDAVDPDATGEVTMTLTERSAGSDQISAVHMNGEQRDSYSFTVTDPDRGLCAYNRRSDGKTAPPHIRRALIDFGYHDTSGPPESPIWFPEYARVLIPMLTGATDTAESELVRKLLTQYLTMLTGTLRAAYTVCRFESPQDVPDELVDQVFQQGAESPLFGAESWTDVDQHTLQMEISVAEWDFDQSFLPQPPRSDPEGWGSYLYAEGDEEGKTAEDTERRLAEALASAPTFPYISDPETLTDSENAGLSPSEGAQVQVDTPDNPDTGDYIRVVQYGAESVTQHEFRITTLPSEDAPGECVFESRNPETALPPYATIHAVSSTDYVVQNTPSFRLDATAAEIVKNSYEVMRAVLNRPPVSDIFDHQLKMVSQPLVLLWYALTAVDVA
ncbi:hypothetical protein ACFQDD_02060, partial [Halorubrum pallidum]